MLGVVVVVMVCIAGCTTPAPPEPTPTEKNIVETAVDDGRFVTLVAALRGAGLDETLSDETKDYTVFAPTNDAFAALPEGTVEALLEEPEGQLKEILLYHVADGMYPAADVAAMDTIPTLQGSALTINATGDSVQVDGATVIIADVECSNGIIHVIDAVMIPPES